MVQLVSLLGKDNASGGGANVQVTSMCTTKKRSKDGRLAPSEDNLCLPL